VWQTKEFKSNDFGSVAKKGVRGEFFGCVARKRLSGEWLVVSGERNCEERKAGTGESWGSPVDKSLFAIARATLFTYM
jgi:hypothetical protein